MNTTSREILVGDGIRLGDGPLFLIAGPCVIESEEHAADMAEKILAVCKGLGIPLIFKASFDKANRTSINSYRGPGLEKGLAILSSIKKRLGIPVISDIHEPSQAETAAAVLDVIQIPALLCRQTDLLLAAARTGKTINIKKGQFIAPWDMSHIVEKVQSAGNSSVLLTERGTMFGYNNLVFDPRSIPIMKRLGFPVLIDASHAVQKPGGQGHVSGGDRDLVPAIARAGVAAGADGVFLEIHDAPDKAMSDGRNSLLLNSLRNVCETLCRLRKALEGGDSGEKETS